MSGRNRWRLARVGASRHGVPGSPPPIGTPEPHKGDFEHVAVSSAHTCAIDFDGRVDCWSSLGKEEFYEYNDDPEGTWAAVDTGMSETCLLAEDGTIDCRGGGYISGYEPEGVYTKLDVGTHLACAISQDGEVVCFGSEVDDLTIPSPEGTEWVDVSAGDTGGCAVDGSGLTVCFGLDGVSDTDLLWKDLADRGPVANVDYYHMLCVQYVDGPLSCAWSDIVDYGTGWTDFTAGWDFACGIRDGEVECFGTNLPEGAPPYRL